MKRARYYASFRNLLPQEDLDNPSPHDAGATDDYEVLMDYVREYAHSYEHVGVYEDGKLIELIMSVGDLGIMKCKVG